MKICKDGALTTSLKCLFTSSLFQCSVVVMVHNFFFMFCEIFPHFNLWIMPVLMLCCQLLRGIWLLREESVIPLQVARDNSRPGVKSHYDTWFANLKVCSKPRISSLRNDGEKVHCWYPVPPQWLIFKLLSGNLGSEEHFVEDTEVLLLAFHGKLSRYEPNKLLIQMGFYLFSGDRDLKNKD